MTTNVVLHPLVLQRRAGIDAMRLELAELCDAWLQLTMVELPGLRYRYDELFGSLERRIQERTLDLQRRRRMVEMFALKLDRGQRLDAKMVELVMKAVRNQTQELEARVQRAMHIGQRSAARPEPATRERAREARELYRRLVRQLHPDARCGDDPACRRYWDVVQQAWLRTDLEMLRAIHHIVTELGPATVVPPGVLDIEERRLLDSIKGERRRLEAMRDIEPYTIRDRIRDLPWIDERTQQLQGELEGLESDIAKCDTFLDPIFERVEATEPQDIVRDLWADWVDRMYLSRKV